MFYQLIMVGNDQSRTLRLLLGILFRAWLFLMFVESAVYKYEWGGEEMEEAADRLRDMGSAFVSYCLMKNSRLVRSSLGPALPLRLIESLSQA